MKLLITGVCGQLGYDAARECRSRGWEVVGTDLPSALDGPELPLDLTDPEKLRMTLEKLRPEAVIHCAAWTSVDAAEEPENRQKVWEINADATRTLAEQCARLGAKLLYISTDYVFDGQGSEPWTPEQTHFAPCNVYGASKLAGEAEIQKNLDRYFIIRTSWVFGKNGKNFVKTMLRAGRNNNQVRVVNDQIGTPTYTRDLAVLLADLAASENYGIYHATNGGGFVSWYDFAREIYRQAGLSTKVIPVTTEEYGLSKAARPRNSRLSKEKLERAGFHPLPDWKDALSRYLREIGEI